MSFNQTQPFTKNGMQPAYDDANSTWYVVNASGDVLAGGIESEGDAIEWIDRNHGGGQSSSRAHVAQDGVGTVQILRPGMPIKRYTTQAAFAATYGLNSDAVPAVCSECGGRGEIETGIGMMACTSCPV